MSRLNRLQLNPSGLSKQSTRTYKAVRQKSNTDLDKTLKQLKLEHKASISKILQEEYTLKNVQHSLKGQEMSDEAGSEEGLQEKKVESFNDADHMLGENNAFVSKMASFKPKQGNKTHKKRHSFHLPSILEENSRCVVTQAPKTQFDNLLPPLIEFNSSPSRGIPEGESERTRSKTISIPDETRHAESHRFVMRKRPSNGRFTGNMKRKDQHKDFDNDSTPEGWGEEMTIGRRFLRRSHSSPNVFDI